VKVFVDTGYYIALISRQDQWHAQASAALHPDLTIYTSSLVINETISLLQARGFLSIALDFLRETRHNTALRIVCAEAAIQRDAWELFGRWSGAGANAVDCVSFAIMQQFGIRKAFTFDRHFETAGFETLR
jgi:predicted nucleic acid-binding protein